MCICYSGANRENRDRHREGTSMKEQKPSSYAAIDRIEYRQKLKEDNIQTHWLCVYVAIRKLFRMDTGSFYGL